MKEINGVRRFGCWAGRPQGTPEDPKHCIEEVHSGERGGLFHQCHRPRGHGPDGLYCKQHSPEAVAARNAASKERADRYFRNIRASSQRVVVAEVARKVFRQEATLDDLEREVAKLEELSGD